MVLWVTSVLLRRLHRQAHPGVEISWRLLFDIALKHQTRKAITVTGYSAEMTRHGVAVMTLIPFIRRYVPDALHAPKQPLGQRASQSKKAAD
jgi:hypothetical protein